MKKALVDFDEKHETLLDYFAIIGFDNGQLRKLINEMQESESIHNYLEGMRQAKQKNFKDYDGMLLRPSVLERFPQMERHKCDFPADLHEYFLDVQESVVTWTEREEQEQYIAETL